MPPKGKQAHPISLRNAAIQDARNGDKVGDICGRYNLAHGTVSTWLSRAKIKTFVKKERPPLKYKIKLTSEVKSKILQEYNDGSLISYLSIKYNINAGSILKWMKREGLKSRKDVRIGIYDNDILILHKLGKNVRDIMQELKVSQSLVRCCLYRNNLSPNKANRRKIRLLNDDYFEKINSYKCAYFFGLLCADGCIHSKINRISINLKEPDGYLIEQLRDELKSDAPIHKFQPKMKNAHRMWGIQFYSEKMRIDLINLGCHDRKSTTIKFPEIESKYFWSFFRGYFDGNGCISFAKRVKVNDTKRVSISSSLFFNTTLKDILKKQYGISSCLSIHKKYRITELVVNKKADVEKIRNLMYGDRDIYMKRKKGKFFIDNYYKK